MHTDFPGFPPSLPVTFSLCAGGYSSIRVLRVVSNRCFSLCLHFDVISDRLFKQFGLLMLFVMWGISVRQRSHCLLPFLYAVALDNIDHCIFGSGPKPFSHTYVDNDVEFFLFIFLNESIWL